MRHLLPIITLAILGCSGQPIAQPVAQPTPEFPPMPDAESPRDACALVKSLAIGTPVATVANHLGAPRFTSMDECGKGADTSWSCWIWVYDCWNGSALMLVLRHDQTGWVLNSTRPVPQ